MNLDLGGKVAVVTGASGAIGSEIASALSREGMDVALISRKSDALEKVRAQIEANGRKAAVIPADLKDRAAAASSIAEAIRAFSGIDLLVNCAGDTKGGDFFKLTDDDWAAGFELKFFGSVRVTRAAWPHLKASKGAIVNIIGGNARMGGALYTIGGSVNSAFLSFTKSMADLGNTDGVRVNAINPGVLETSRLENRIDLTVKQTGGTREQAKKTILDQMRVPRFGTPTEIAAMVALLASPLSAFTQGAIIDMDGGFNRAT